MNWAIFLNEVLSLQELVYFVTKHMNLELNYTSQQQKTRMLMIQ